MKLELLLGAGHKHDKQMWLPTQTRAWDNLITLDFNEDTQPDILCDLNTQYWEPSDFGVFTDLKVHYRDRRFSENLFNEVHAYEVLEHLGRQGDFKSFFDTFENIYRILKPNGLLFASCPSRKSPWLWGDPGHTRIISKESISFLEQTFYDQCGHTAASDYRFYWKSDFLILEMKDDGVNFQFVLQAVKPSRIKT